MSEYNDGGLAERTGGSLQGGVAQPGGPNTSTGSYSNRTSTSGSSGAPVSDKYVGPSYGPYTYGSIPIKPYTGPLLPNYPRNNIYPSPPPPQVGTRPTYQTISGSGYGIGGYAQGGYFPGYEDGGYFPGYEDGGMGYYFNPYVLARRIFGGDVVDFLQ